MIIRSEKGIGYYKQPKSGREYTSEELIAHWESLVDKYPIISIEDGLDEEDWEGWKLMTERIGHKVQVKLLIQQSQIWRLPLTLVRLRPVHLPEQRELQNTISFLELRRSWERQPAIHRWMPLM